ncbi:hypothetical protein Q9Q99_10680 [Curtobacterium flaccumfaciens]|nr:hypothetical protein Q9Q99_10680 [Curtobacterium flaccumfaciens]
MERRSMRTQTLRAHVPTVRASIDSWNDERCPRIDCTGTFPEYPQAVVVGTAMIGDEVGCF